MHELTDEWLRQTNETFSKYDVPHGRRPWLAWGEWAKYTGRTLAMDDDEVTRIFSWFEKNTKAGAQQIGPMYTGVYYYDSCFWPVFIPHVYGKITINIRDSLKRIPVSIEERLWADNHKLQDFVSIWANCFDYAFGFAELLKTSPHGQFAQELINSGDQQIKATVALLLERSPNSKSMEAAQMSTEMYLKAFLAAKVGLTEKEAKNKIGHDLQEALDRCLAVDPNSEFKTILPSLKIFPGIEDRYKGTEKKQKDLWGAYKLAQYVGTTVIRAFTGCDVRKKIKIN